MSLTEMYIVATMNSMKKLNNLEFVLLLVIAVLAIGVFVVTDSLAEQGTGTPDSGEDSILKATYDSLSGLGFGSDEGSYSPMWNRIRSSATWVPDGTVSESDVLKGKIFYEGGRVPKTGTLDYPSYEAQSLQAMDFRDPNGSGSFSSWERTNANPMVWQDKRSGLYWSPSYAKSTNEFTLSTCPFFSTTPRGDYNGGDPTNCGTAIETCATLSLDANGDGTNETKWYLPTQAELLQAYLDGIYQRTDTSWVTNNYFWSSTQSQSTSSGAWYVALDRGSTLLSTKTSSYGVRCVLRDL